MKIEKQILLSNIDKVYATCIGEVDGERIFIGASEGAGECKGIIGNKISRLWDGPGGTMNIVPIPGRDGEFYATQRFLPVFAAEDCTLNHVKYNEGEWEIKEIMKTPYLHRFDLFEKDNKIYFIGASLCGGKDFVQDWSRPGAVYIGKLNDEVSKSFEVKKIYEGITKNHGFCKVVEGNKFSYLITGVEGVFSFQVPAEPRDDDWTIEKLMDHEVSDIAVCDIDQDGVLEYATIEPFHGNKCVIYKYKDGELSPQKEYAIEFGHVIWGGKLAKKPSFLLGYRKEKMELKIIQFDGEYKDIIVDENIGPSQISVMENNTESLVLSANRQVNELALYKINLDK